MSPHRFIRALLRQPVDRTPIWIMRQAGRYLPEYRAARKKVGDFLMLCKTPELACELSLQPLQRFDLDAAIIFSDILTIPEAMGLSLRFVEGVGPQFLDPIRSLAAIEALTVPDPLGELRYVCDAIALCRSALQNRVPLIGFAGSPWTLACYMVEGQSSKEFRWIKSLLYQEPQALHRLLHRLTTVVTASLNAQIQAGAQVVMLFDSWGGLLSSEAYLTFSLAYIKQIISHLIREYNQQLIPVVVFAKGAALWLEAIADSTCEAIGLDWTVDIGQARRRLQGRVALQGNMDPAVLYADPQRIREEVTAILTRYGPGTGHVFNLGHGLSQYTAIEKVKVLVEAVHELSPCYHTAVYTG